MTEIESLQASRVALMIAFAAIIRTHPNFVPCQMLLTTMLEHELGDGASIGKDLTPAQKDHTRDLVEWMQTAAPSPQKTAWRPPAN